VKLWDYKTGNSLKNFKGHRNGVNCIRFNDSTTRMISSSDDETVIIWDIESGEKIRALRGHQQRIIVVIYSRDYEFILSGS